MTHIIKIISLAFALTAGPSAVGAQTLQLHDESVAAAKPGPAVGGTLALSFSGIKTPTGAVMVALFDSQAGYESNKAARHLMIPVSGESASATIQGLTPGTWAIKAFHDVDGDGKMSVNPFGMPTEPYAFSNDARGSMGPATWAAAAFAVPASGGAQTIHID